MCGFVPRPSIISRLVFGIAELHELGRPRLEDGTELVGKDVHDIVGHGGAEYVVLNHRADYHRGVLPLVRLQGIASAIAVYRRRTVRTV